MTRPCGWTPCRAYVGVLLEPADGVWPGQVMGYDANGREVALPRTVRG